MRHGWDSDGEFVVVEMPVYNRGPMDRITDSAVLAVLDDAARPYQFPVCLGADQVLYGSSRLMGFRNPQQWLVTIEVLSFSVSMDLYEVLIWAFGNGIRSGLMPYPFLEPIRFEPSLYQRDEMPSPFDFEIVINGELKRFRPSAQDYAAAGIDPSVPMPLPAMILRYLIHIYGYALFPPVDFVVQHAGVALGSMHPLVRRDEWSHTEMIPMTYENRFYQLPSEVRFFRELARAIELDDPHFPYSPDPPNTHWRHQFENEYWP